MGQIKAAYFGNLRDFFESEIRNTLLLLNVGAWRHADCACELFLIHLHISPNGFHSYLLHRFFPFYGLSTHL